MKALVIYDSVYGNTESIARRIGGLVVGSGLATNRLRSLMVKVVIFFAVAVVLAIVIQNIQNFALS